ncbi:hypothetical protein Pint_10637 [Pistacia integerrima]|uniref:Uncharacterized protein n=1 Tax=Pistacia integerrima TaxID=434235 RepID=A0ACC0XKK9_9ROSI|nr:hypothetical protein Pint_10637 [Pistacia integerrima]
MLDQEPGHAEADFGRLDAKTIVKSIYILFSRSEIPIAAENQEIMDLVDASTPLPAWKFHEDYDVAELTVKVPALLIMGDKDYVLKFSGMEEYIRSGKVKDFVPDLEIVHLPEGTHFVQEQLPDEVNQIILTFLNKHV